MEFILFFQHQLLKRNVTETMLYRIQVDLEVAQPL